MLYEHFPRIAQLLLELRCNAVKAAKGRITTVTLFRGVLSISVKVVKGNTSNWPYCSLPDFCHPATSCYSKAF